MKCPKCGENNRAYWKEGYGGGWGKAYYKCRCGKHYTSEDKDKWQQDTGPGTSVPAPEPAKEESHDV